MDSSISLVLFPATPADTCSSQIGNHRVQIFSPQGQCVSFLAAGMLKHPCHLFVDSDDHIHVADHRNQRVLVFLPTGQLIKIFKTGELNPLGVCVNDEGRVIICGSQSKNAEITDSEVLIF